MQGTGDRATDCLQRQDPGEPAAPAAERTREPGPAPGEHGRPGEVRDAERNRLEDVTRHIGVGLAIISRDFRTQWANTVLKELFGEVEGRSCFLTFNQRNRICDSCGVREVFATGKDKVVHEQVGKDKDGHTIWSQVIATPIREPGGHITAALEVVVPITERKRAEVALAASERQYRRLFEAARDGILILDAVTGVIVDVNPYLLELTGSSREEYLGKHLWEIGPFKDVAACKASFAELQQKKYVRHEDLPLQARDGRTVDVEFVSNVYSVGERKVIQCNVRDITARKRGEERDRLARDVLELLNRQGMASLPIRDILLLVRKSTNLEAVGIRLREGDDFPYCVTAGFPEEFVVAERTLCARGPDGGLRRDAQGNPVLECMCGNVLCGRTDPTLPFFTAGGSFWTNSTTDLLASTQGTDRPWLTRNRCNREGYESLALLPLRSGDEIIGLLQLNDRRRNRFTPEMVRFLEGLGTSIGIALARNRGEAERKKLEEQLRMSQKMEAIGSLAGGVAHDFNNLLSVILNCTGFALDGMTEDDPLRDDLREVKKAGERAAVLTRQLLAFSRKQLLQPEPLCLNRIAAELEEMLRRILSEDIEFAQVLAPDLGLTLADPSQIAQVLMNLVVNARDAMPKGGRLTLETANVDLGEAAAASHLGLKPGPYVVLAVTDTGCGMDAPTRARIFEPFFTTKATGKGTGLGLSTVHGIVKQSNGEIWVYSEPGRGTTFKIYLPRAPAAATAKASRPPTVPRQSTGTETILLVEDEEAVRMVARRSLVAAGYTVLTAADGDEALLESVRHAGDIHLLLADVVMPRMSGKALAQELSKTRPTVAILYMSGYTDNAIVHHGVLDPDTHFLAKPFTAADLRRKVREVLDEGSADPPDGPGRAAGRPTGWKERPLDKDALRALPADVLARLRRAVVAARYDELVELVETIRLTQPEVATGLRRMADRFDYGGLRDLQDG